MALTVGSLFSGIGGFDKGLEDTGGFDIAWQVENNEYCRKVLKKHWPSVPCHYDIRAIDWHFIPPVDLICGGFPCQPFSTASRGRRTADSLWPEMFKAIECLRPTWVLAENVSGAAKLALKEVEDDLEGIGYQTTPPLEIPACAVGLDHWRPRYWILGYSDGNRKSVGPINAEVARLPRVHKRTRRDREKNGVSHRMDRLRALGNAVVPAIVEVIGRMILKVERGGEGAATRMVVR